MKKILALLLCCCFCMVDSSAIADGFQVKKASPVKVQEKSGLDSVTSNSLLPGVLGLVSGVSALTAQQKELAKECEPSDSDIRWVNDMIKEVAKAGLGAKVDDKAQCSDDAQYKEDVEHITSNSEICTPVFSSTDDKGKVWEGYPKAMSAYYCTDAAVDSMSDCPSAKKKMKTNVYEVFGKIEFTKDDLLASEITGYDKMSEKASKCSQDQVAKRQKEAYTNFVKGTISTAGQTTGNTNLGGIFDAVGGLTSSGSGLSGIGSLGQVATQFLAQ